MLRNDSSLDNILKGLFQKVTCRFYKFEIVPHPTWMLMQLTFPWKKKIIALPCFQAEHYVCCGW